MELLVPDTAYGKPLMAQPDVLYGGGGGCQNTLNHTTGCVIAGEGMGYQSVPLFGVILGGGVSDSFPNWD